jgi:signal transduction histidine kinase
LRSARAETDRLAQLTDDLLLLARADAGELPLRRSDVGAVELLETIATRYQRRAEDGGRTIEVAAPVDLVLRCDRRRLEQALGNLVENSLRYGCGAIRLEAASTGGTLDLTVGDEGPGFPPAFVSRAFDRFSRADGSHETSGTGLGLAIVAVIAHAHGGTAVISNERDGGAAVTLRLPGARRPRSGSGELLGDEQDSEAEQHEAGELLRPLAERLVQTRADA